jgi:hypothetical protein
VATTFERLEDGSIEHAREGLTLVDGNERVAISPQNEERRKLFDFIHTVQEVPALTAPVDDVAHRPREGACRARLRIQSAELLDLLSGYPSPGPAERQVRSKGHERLAEILDDPGERREAEPSADPLAETAGGDENEPSDPLGTLEEEHLCNAPAERVTHDVGLLQADGLDPPSDDVRIPIELVSRIRTLGLTMPRQIRHQHAPIDGQEWRDVRPREGRVVEPMKEHDRRRRRRFPDLDPMKSDALDRREILLHRYT